MSPDGPEVIEASFMPRNYKVTDMKKKIFLELKQFYIRKMKTRINRFEWIVFCSYEKKKKVSLQHSVPKMESDWQLYKTIKIRLLYTLQKTQGKMFQQMQSRQDISWHIFTLWTATMVKHRKVFNTLLIE